MMPGWEEVYCWQRRAAVGWLLAAVGWLSFLAALIWIWVQP